MPDNACPACGNPKLDGPATLAENLALVIELLFLVALGIVVGATAVRILGPLDLFAGIIGILLLTVGLQTYLRAHLRRRGTRIDQWILERAR